MEENFENFREFPFGKNIESRLSNVIIPAVGLASASAGAYLTCTNKIGNPEEAGFVAWMMVGGVLLAYYGIRNFISNYHGFNSLD